MTKEMIDGAIASLKQKGVRMTPQRYAILEYMASSETHPTADDIFKSLSPQYPNMSVATVYNNLRMFKEAGLIKELTYGDSSSRFDFDTHDHYHVICEKCKKIVDFQYPALHEVEMLAKHVTGFEVNSHRLELYGVCADCKEEDKVLN